MKVIVKEVQNQYIVYIMDEPSGRPIKAETVDTLQEANIIKEKFTKTVASME